MSGPARSAVAGDADEQRLLADLRAGDEAAFVTLVERYQASMVRVATAIVGSRAIAEEVTQDAWVGVLRGIDRFEGRSSLKTWLFRILTNRALSRRERERRSVPFSALARRAGLRGGGPGSRAVPAGRPSAVAQHLGHRARELGRRGRGAGAGGRVGAGHR